MSTEQVKKKWGGGTGEKTKFICDLYAAGDHDWKSIYTKAKLKFGSIDKSTVVNLVKRCAKRTAEGKPLQYAAGRPPTSTSATPKTEATVEPATVTVTAPQPITAPPEVTAGLSTTEMPPTETPQAEQLITPEEVQALIETLNNLPPDEKYRIAKETTPILGKTWAKVINKRLSNVADPNFDLYFAAIITVIAVSKPLMNFARDQIAKRKATTLKQDKADEKMEAEKTAKP